MSLLFHSNQPCVKRDSVTFDVTVRAYDGSEICEFVGMFMLSLLSKTFKTNTIGLYCNDGLSAVRNISVKQAEKILKIIYFDVGLNLNDGTYLPFHKPNVETTNIDVKSDHSRQIIKKNSKINLKRLSRISSTKEIFENSKDYYDQRLRQCGYNEKLNYTKQNNIINPKSRKGSILWFKVYFTANLSKLMSVDLSFT